MNKKILTLGIPLTLVVLFFLFFHHQHNPQQFHIPKTAQNTLEYEGVFIPPHPQVSATNYTVINAENGDIIVNHNGDKPRAPASLTKLMTVYVVEKELASGRMKLSDSVPISEKAWKMTGSKMFVEVGKHVSVEDLLKGVIIQSGNDAAVALAEYAAGSEKTFVDMMNQTAKELGLTHSHFTNVSGLPHKDHYMSSNDLATLSQHIIQDFPENYHIYGIKSFTFNNINQKNRNRLLFKDPTVDGLKTGHTQDAGYCLAASSKRDNTRFIVIVMGTKSEQKRLEETQKLMSYVFRFYENDTLYPAKTTIEKTNVWQGTNPIDVGSKHAVSITIPNKTAKEVSFVFHYKPQLSAPILPNQEVGYMEIKWKNATLKNVPLIALNASHRKNMIMRGLTYLRYAAYDYWVS